MNKSTIYVTGLIGLVGAMLTGVGEFILHFDTLSRFGTEYAFLEGIPDGRSTLGHFVGVFGAPLYLAGCWHIRLMLQPASERWSLIAFLIATYGFVVGAVWIGSRASISALVNIPPSPDTLQLISLYDLRYETLLQVIRTTVLLLSVIYIWLTATGRSHYPKWMAALNPILLIVANFVVFAIAPEIGKYLMPIALNVAFGLFFAASLLVAHKRSLN